MAITRHAAAARLADQPDTPTSTVRTVRSAVIRDVSREVDALVVTPDERSRIIAGLAFFHGMTQETGSDPWRQWRAAEAQIDSVLKGCAPDSES